MRRQPAVADLVFRCNTMDKTLKEYIDRTMKKITEERNQPVKPNPNQYFVYPEKQSEDSDEKINPHGQH